MSVDLSGAITAIATVVLALFALATAFYARQAFRKQSREVGILAGQNEWAIHDRRIEQASRVFIWEDLSSFPTTRSLPGGGYRIDGPEAPRVTAHVRNTSDQPLYDVELRWPGSATLVNPNPEPLGMIMPGGETQKIRDFPLGTDKGVSGVGLRFRDAAGVWWIRGPDGGLAEQQ